MKARINAYTVVEANKVKEMLPLLGDHIVRPKVEVFGQVFTPDNIVDEMLALMCNRGAVLEPSCGDGAFVAKLGDKVTGIEIDTSLPPRKNVIQGDFFAHPISHKYATIIGNPPYVRHQDILPATKTLLPMQRFDQRSNLYLFFIDKCIQHLTDGGELIFITPRDFLKATSAQRLNKFLFEAGSFTYFRELGDAAVFKGYTPNCAIWRWQKGLFVRRTAQGQYFNHHCGQIWFSNRDESTADKRETLGIFFDVKVGAVSGADHIFSDKKNGNINMVCSSTVRDGKTRRMIYNTNHPCLKTHKKTLLARKIRTFSENNWWEWGRKYCKSNMPRIYVNCKTRARQPFFVHKEMAYDGSVLALIPKSANTDVNLVAEKLNKINWEKLGFVVDGRLLFTQRSLANAPCTL